jgi:tight adherence protein B
MADALRSGLNLGQAVDLAATDAGPPLGAELRRASRETTVGTPLDRALGAFAQRCAVPGADVLAVASAIASRTGADLAPILDGIVAAARDRDRLRREMRAATAQGRLTAMVVAALPFAFLLVLGAGARGETHVLLHEPIGWVLLGVGGGLQAAGFLWIRRTVRS